MSNTSSPSSAERRLQLTLTLCALFAGSIVVLIGALLLAESTQALWAVGPVRFLTDGGWNPTEDSFGLWPMLAGTLATTALALLLAAPLGVLSAAFCRFYAPVPIAGVYRKLIELLAGIPSVVYGFWGLTVLVPLIGEHQPPGASLLAGALIVALMVLPTVALLSEAAFANVPTALTRGAAALGLSRWATIRGVVLPVCKSGLFTAVVLATGRAIGETMAVLMVCGNVVRVPSSVFDPVRTLTANIALEMAYAMDVHRSALFVSGLVLALLVTGLIVLADWADEEVVHG